MAKTKKATAKVAIDRRAKSTRRESDRRKKSTGVKVEQRKVERRQKVARRRQIDPTTCERDYTDDEVAFMQALDTYKRRSGRMFPTCSEVLEVIRDLGYVNKETGDAPRISTDPPAGESSDEGVKDEKENG